MDPTLTAMATQKSDARDGKMGSDRLTDGGEIKRVTLTGSVKSGNNYVADIAKSANLIYQARWSNLNPGMLLDNLAFFEEERYNRYRPAVIDYKIKNASY